MTHSDVLLSMHPSMAGCGVKWSIRNVGSGAMRVYGKGFRPEARASASLLIFAASDLSVLCAGAHCIRNLGECDSASLSRQ